MGDFNPNAFDAGAEPFQEEEALEGEEEGPGDEPQLRDALLFLIDCSFPAVLEPLSAGGRSLVAEALALAASVLKTKVITAPEDRVGVAFHGVREKRNPNGFDGIFVLQDLDRASAQRIRELENEATRTAAQFEERYGVNQRVPLSDMFWTCTTIFNLSAPPAKFHPRVFLFTGNDSPCPTPSEQIAAETRAQDMMELGVEVEFFPLVPEGKYFSMERFWARVLPKDEDDYVGTAEIRIEELDRRVRKRVHRKRTLQRATLRLCPDVEIGVSIFVTILEAHIPLPEKLLNTNNKKLTSISRHICQATGGILVQDDIETYIELAGQRVYMTREEVNETKRFFEPGLQLLGFKLVSKLQPHHRIFHSYFVYPNNRAITGSAALCSALINQMLERKLMALARYVPRRSSEPSLVALVPQAESQDAAGSDQVKVPGFHMVRLPWGEEIRELDFPAPTDGTCVSPLTVEAARRVVDAMCLDAFTPGCAENPVLQRHYAAVQALALAEDQPEETVDVLQPDMRTLEEKAPLLKAWHDVIDATCPPGAPPLAGTPGAGAGVAGYKRPLLPFDEEAPRGRPRREAPGMPATPEEMREMVRTGEVDRLTVPQLRDWLKSQGISCSGKKADLVYRVRAVA